MTKRNERSQHDSAADSLLDEGAVRGNVSGGIGENPVSTGGDVGDQGNLGAARPPSGGPRAASRLGPDPDPQAGVTGGLSAAGRREGAGRDFDPEAAVAHDGETGAGGFSRVLEPRDRPTNAEARIEQMRGAMPGGDTPGAPDDLERSADGDEVPPRS